MPKNLYIIDGHAQIYRAYYARMGELNAPSGEPTRATHVFCQMLLNLIRDRQPDYLVMVLDADETKLIRRELYPEYKAQREPPPEDLPVQTRRIVSILEVARVPILRMERYEADDIIATLAARFGGPDLHINVVSRDKDLEQLLSDHISLYDPMKDEVVTPAKLVEQKGWSPEQAIEAQILTGDTVDNVPGVPGIGPKTAAKLLEKYGSAQGVVDHADELTPKQRENVLAFAPRIELTRKLVTLDHAVPIELDLEAAVCTRFDWAAARPIFAELGFRRLLEQLPGLEDGDDATAAVPAVPGDAAAKLCEPDGGDYQLVNTPEALDKLVAELAKQPEFAVDTETTGISAIDSDMVGLSLSWEVGRGYYVPVRAAMGTVLPLELVRAKLGPLLADQRIRKVGQNLKYDLIVLRNAGLPVAGPMFDTMIAAFLTLPERSSFGLDKLVRDLMAHEMIPITDLIGKGRDQLRMDLVPLEHVAEYAAEDADYTWRLRLLLEPKLEPLGGARLFDEIEMPLVSVLTEMEYNGVQLDADFLVDMGRGLARRVDELEAKAHKLAGRPFNLDSPKQLGEVLFDEFNFRVVRRTKTTRSTDADTLETLARETDHELPKLMLEYREIQKLRGTYVDALPGDRSRRTGRIHTSFHQTGAITGRLSSSEPNLQNIPVRTEMGREIRRAFVPRTPEERLIVADYSQVELRVLAHFCEDEALIRAFSEDRDIHAFVASQVNGVPLDEVTKEMRARAKTVNFGIIYGQTAFGLSQSTSMNRGEAQAFIDAYFARYPRIQAFIDRCVEDAKRDGYVRTILGRRRPISDISSGNANVRAQAQRLAVNTVVQGSAADLIKTAMVNLDRRIRAEQLPLRMLIQVHDELVCEAPADRAPEMADIVTAVMTGAMKLRVPLKVDTAIGRTWLEAK
ncbi:MAG: DNA polymerase I [Phycisphaerae bacterium]|nr:DNA polymerase I [Phycisphaerae bacterium]